MEIVEKKIIASLAIMTVTLLIASTLKGNEAAVATCKEANQICMIVISQGEQTKYPGLLTVK